MIFHFVRLSNISNIYNSIYFFSLKESFTITEEDLFLEFTDNKYPYKYNITERIVLLGNNNSKTFLITINKHVENHYNVIIDTYEDKKTYSLEVIIYSKIKKCLEDIYNMKILESYKKENDLPNMLRFNVINTR